MFLYMRLLRYRSANRLGARVGTPTFFEPSSPSDTLKLQSVGVPSEASHAMANGTRDGGTSHDQKGSNV